MHNPPPPSQSSSSRPARGSAVLEYGAALSSFDSPRRRSDSNASASTSGSGRPFHDSPVSMETIRHRRKLSKRRQRAVQAARTERLSDEVAALQSDVLHLQQHLRSVEMLSQSPRDEAVATRELPSAASSALKSTRSQVEPDGRPFPSQERASTDVEGSAEDTAAAAAQLRRFVVCFQHGWTSDMLTDLGHFVHDQVEIVTTGALTIAPPAISDEQEVGLRGIETKWKRCCETTRGFHMALQQLVPLEPPQEWLLSIEMTVQLTYEAIALGFPHVIQAASTSPSTHANASEVMAKLVAAPLRLDVQCHAWLDGDFKIVKFDVVFGWAAALLACLGNPDDVLWVLKSPRPLSTGTWCS